MSFSFSNSPTPSGKPNLKKSFSFSNSPTPSGKTNLKKSNSKLNLFPQVKHVMDEYDDIILEQANTPTGRKNPDTLEYLTRQRNIHMQAKIDEQEAKLQDADQTVQQLWTEKDEILAELDQMRSSDIEIRQENEKLRNDLTIMNETLQDIQNNQTIDMSFFDETGEFSTGLSKNREFAILQDELSKQKHQNAYKESLMAIMQGNHEENLEENKAQINRLQFQLSEAITTIDENQEKIQEHINLNHTITDENSNFQEIIDEYKEKIIDYQVQLSMIKGQSALRAEELTRIHGEFSLKNEKKNTELAILSRKLNCERANRVSAAQSLNTKNNLYRSASIKIKKLERNGERLEAEKNDLERELQESRMEVKRYQDKKKSSKIAKMKKFLKHSCL